jgi:CTP synthase
VCGLHDANSTEFDAATQNPVIGLLEEQKNIAGMGASMRLGAYPCKLLKSSVSYCAYKKENISERHRHRYEFNNKYKKIMEQKGLVFAGRNLQKDLVEVLEIKKHPWFVACQFHPEFKSKPDRCHPLFRDFIKSALMMKA